VVAKVTPPLIVIVGPTASGKSDLAMDVAQRYGGEIICADSRTIYKGMDVGTAKPTKGDRERVPHHLLDVAEPGQYFTVADFKRLANEAIIDIWSRGKWPILVGGSGLYVDSVIFDYEFGTSADAARRDELNAKTVEELQEICNQNNIELPENRSNKRYLVRAIELGGVINQPRKLRGQTIVVGIATDREELLFRVEARAQKMLSTGIIEEVASLGSKYGWDNEAMKGNIYRVFRGVVEGTKDVEAALQECVVSDMKLIKKQITWFKRNKQIIWGDAKELKMAIEQFIARHGSKATT
jgi:tRNA dimethylallyltransferase